LLNLKQLFEDHKYPTIKEPPKSNDFEGDLPGNVIMVGAVFFLLDKRK